MSSFTDIELGINNIAIHLLLPCYGLNCALQVLCRFPYDIFFTVKLMAYCKYNVAYEHLEKLTIR